MSWRCISGMAPTLMQSSSQQQMDSTWPMPIWNSTMYFNQYHQQCFSVFALYNVYQWSYNTLDQLSVQSLRSSKIYQRSVASVIVQNRNNFQGTACVAYACSVVVHLHQGMPPHSHPMQSFLGSALQHLIVESALQQLNVAMVGSAYRWVAKQFSTFPLLPCGLRRCGNVAMVDV